MFASTQSEICTDSFSATVRLLRGDQARHGIDSLNELSRTGAPRVICTGLFATGYEFSRRLSVFTRAISRGRKKSQSSG
jgi:hypothetical protein